MTETKAREIRDGNFPEMFQVHIPNNIDHNAARNILARGINLWLAAGLAVTVPGGLALAGPLKGEPGILHEQVTISQGLETA